MLIGKDQGAVVVFFIFAAIGCFVIRRKCRNAAARSEEIKRLLISASEEAARTEIEGYFYTTSSSSASTALLPPYHCAVCFSPTTTRCAKCKVVRYCSGRCQILHWRQGHKDECRSYVKPIIIINQQDDSNQPQIPSFFKSTSEYSTFSTPTISSIETSSPSLEDLDDATKSISYPSDEDILPSLSVSSSLPDDASNEYSFSDFWSGTIHFNKSSIDELQPSASNDKKGGYTMTTLDNSAPNRLGSNKSNDKISSSNQFLTDGFKSTRPPTQTVNHRDVVTRSYLPQSIFKESNFFSSGVGDHSPIKDSEAFGGIPFAIPHKSNHVFNSNSIASPAFKSTSRLASQCAKSVTVHEEKNKVATTSSSKLTENSGSARNGLKTSMVKVVDQTKPSKLTRQCSPRAETQTPHKYSCKELFSYKMFVKLYNWKQVELRPFGLINCGNSCYANAVLQCLTYTPPLNAYLYQGLHSKACDKRGWCFTCEFEGLVLKTKNGNSPLSPIRILSHIENIGSNLGHGREEDAHEFLRYAIDTLQSVCLKESGTNSSNSVEEETTLIGLTFGGYLRSKMQCMKCGGKSERHERMMDLTVEIEGDIGTLEEALNKFTCTEILDGENKYKCSRCKSYERAKKKLTLLEAPNVLTIALKRFQSGKFGKLNKSIHFPEILDMAPYVSGTSDKSPVYRLYGVVVHVDIMNAAFSGHYVCYVKNFENRWFKIDDMNVKEVDVQSVLTKGAYILLYARCSPRAPRLIRSLLWPQHQLDPKKHKVATPSTEPWGVTHDHLAIRHRTLEEESSSSSDGSVIFSETCSCSTESSSSSTPWDWEHEYNSSSTPWKRNMHLNSSDSDTSSSSSSSFPSPLYSRHSSLRE